MARTRRTGSEERFRYTRRGSFRGRQARPGFPGIRRGAPGRADTRLQQSLGFPDTPPLQRAEPQYSRRRRPEDAVYLVNSAENAKELRRRLGVSSKAKVLVVDATKITLEELGQNRPNAPLLGALSHVFTDVPVESFVNHFTSKMTKLPQPVLEANRRAILRGRSEAVFA